MIGETGTGKSTLINNLLGREVAVVGNTMESETLLVTPHELSVEGVPVVVYDTPGLGDTRGDDDEKHLDIMKSLIARKKIHLVIYCMKLTETRMRRSLIRTFKEYHKIGVPWEQTVVTITFADMIVDTTGRFSQVQQHLKKTLVEKVGVTSSVVDRLKICPTAKDPTEALPSRRQWYVPFWLDVVEVLVPAALAQFLCIHQGNIHMKATPASGVPNPVNIPLLGEDQERFRREVDRLSYLPVAGVCMCMCVCVYVHVCMYLCFKLTQVLKFQIPAECIRPEIKWQRPGENQCRCALRFIVRQNSSSSCYSALCKRN